MARTVQQIRDYTRVYLDVDITDIPDTLVDSWITEGQAAILRMRPAWPHLYTTATLTSVAETSDYSVTVEKIEGIQGPDYELIPVEAGWGDASFTPNAADSADAQYWAETAETTAGVNTVRLYPTPSSALAYTVRGFRFPVEPSGASDTPDLPNDFHFPLQTYVVMRACHQQNDFEQGQILAAEWTSTAQALINHYTTDIVRPVSLNRNKFNRRTGPPDRLRFPFEPYGF